MADKPIEDGKSANGFEKIVLASGCFWCTEAIFKRVEGVKSVIPGYSGGHVKNPTYNEVCSGDTGHAEAIQLEFDPKVISLEKILEIFWYTHDPTTLNRQGNDVGTQYRSAVFYNSEQQQEIVSKVKEKISTSGYYSKPIVTEILPFSNFYPAEEYHVDYYDNNRSVPYCSYVIDPKVQKLLKKFPEDLKKQYIHS